MQQKGFSKFEFVHRALPTAFGPIFNSTWKGATPYPITLTFYKSNKRTWEIKKSLPSPELVFAQPRLHENEDSRLAKINTPKQA